MSGCTNLRSTHDICLASRTGLGISYLVEKDMEALLWKGGGGAVEGELELWDSPKPGGPGVMNPEQL